MKNLYIDVRFSFAISKSSGAFNGGNNYTKRVSRLLICNSNEKFNVILACSNGLENNISEILKIGSCAKCISISTLKDLNCRAGDILFIPQVNDSLKYAKELKDFKLNNPKTLIFCTIHDCRYNEQLLDRYDSLLKKGIKSNYLLLWLGRKMYSIERNDAIKKIAALSDKVFTVSSYSMNCLNRYKSIKYVISYYQGVFRDTILSQDYSLDNNYIFCVSAGRPEKNFIRAIKAFEQYIVNSKNSRIKLVATGLSCEQIKMIKERKIIDDTILDNQVVLMGYVDDAELDRLYSECKFLLFVSKNEGFGLPVLEALLHEKPMVLSQTSSIPEVAMGSAVYVDPLSTDSISRGIGFLLDECNYARKKEYVIRKKQIALEQISLDDKAFLNEFE